MQCHWSSVGGHSQATVGRRQGMKTSQRLTGEGPASTLTRVVVSRTVSLRALVLPRLLAEGHFLFLATPVHHGLLLHQSDQAMKARKGKTSRTEATVIYCLPLEVASPHFCFNLFLRSKPVAPTHP